MAHWRDLPEDVLLCLVAYLNASDEDALGTLHPFFLWRMLVRRYERRTISTNNARRSGWLQARLRCVIS
jgi:hypothetical protein